MNDHFNENLDYSIIDFIESSGQLIILCNKTKQKYSIDLPIENGKYPEGIQLDEYIRGFLPSWVIERSQQLQSGISNSDYIKSLVPEKPTENQNKITLEEVKQRRHMLLNQTDWIFLSDSPVKDEEFLVKIKKYRQDLRDITKQDINNIHWPEFPS